MSKVFAVVENDLGRLEVLKWSSAKCFLLDGQNWLDEKFICLATTNDHKKEGLYSNFELLEMKETNYTREIIKSKKETIAHDMMTLAFFNHFKKSICSQAYSAIELAIKEYDTLD